MTGGNVALRVGRGLLWLLLGLELTFAILLHCVLLTGIGLLGIAALQPFRRYGSRDRVLRAGLLLAIPLLVVVTSPVTLLELQGRLDQLSAKLEAAGPRAFRTDEKAAVYLFGLAMGVGGAPLYPEVAKEQLLLMIPGPEVRRWSSSFAMEAGRIRAPLRTFARRLASMRPGVREATLPPQRIAFRYGQDPPRVVLALNPFTMKARAVREGDRWRIFVSGTVPVKYLPRSRIPLLSIAGYRFYVEEGLFWMLQENGWYFPYTAEWSWEVDAASLLSGEH